MAGWVVGAGTTSQWLRNGGWMEQPTTDESEGPAARPERIDYPSRPPAQGPPEPRAIVMGIGSVVIAASFAFLACVPVWQMLAGSRVPPADAMDYVPPILGSLFLAACAYIFGIFAWYYFRTRKPPYRDQ
jgi:hypothetical protein